MEGPSTGAGRTVLVLSFPDVCAEIAQPSCWPLVPHRFFRLGRPFLRGLHRGIQFPLDAFHGLLSLLRLLRPGRTAHGRGAGHFGSTANHEERQYCHQVATHRFILQLRDKQKARETGRATLCGMGGHADADVAGMTVMAYARRVLSSASAATFMCNNRSAIDAHFVAGRVMCFEMAIENCGYV